MRYFLFGCIFVSQFGLLSAQSKFTIENASATKIGLAAEPFVFYSWPGEDHRMQYHYDVPFSTSPELLIEKLFPIEKNVKLGESGNYFNSSINYYNAQVDLSLMKLEHSLSMSFITADKSFDTAGFRKLLLNALQSLPFNESYICDGLPSQIDSIWSDNLKKEVMELIVRNNVRYPTDPFRGYLISFEVDKLGQGVGKYPSDDTTFTFGVANKFPLVEVNGKPVAYTITPYYLYEEYFTNNIELDLKNDSSNVTLMDKAQRLYFYDIGYPQMYAGFDDTDFGQYYMVEMDENEKVVQKLMVPFYDLSLVVNEFYNNDEKPDFAYYAQYDVRVVPHWVKTIYFKDSIWEFEDIEYTSYLQGNCYEYFIDQQAFEREYYFDFGVEEPTDSLIENWSLDIFSQSYKSFRQLIRVSKQVTDITPEAQLQKKFFKRKYKYEYDMHSIYDAKLNYQGNSKVKGEKALRAMQAHIDFYRRNPERLELDIK